MASNLVVDNKKPIIGINSNPEKSEGHLLLPRKYTKNIAEIFEMLKAGHYSILMRRRIRITLKGEGIWKPTFHMHEKGRVVGGERYITYIHINVLMKLFLIDIHFPYCKLYQQ